MWLYSGFYNRYTPETLILTRVQVLVVFTVSQRLLILDTSTMQVTARVDLFMMRKGLFSGTFDPPTLGHLDIIMRGACLCDKLIVAIGVNTRKQPLFTVAERVDMLKELTHGLTSVEVTNFTTLVIDFAHANGIDFILRGLRSASDLPHEFEMALANRKMSGIETLFLMADAHHAQISSSLIREIAASGRHLEKFVPQAVVEPLYQRVKIDHQSF